MEDGHLVRRRDDGDGVVVLKLHDPERRNAMTAAMGSALESTFAALSEDTDLRAVVLTGTPPAFSAGGDLNMLADHGRRARDGQDQSQAMRSFYGRFLSVADLHVPVVAAVNGHAIGAGLCVALACDLMITEHDAKLALNFARIGLHPGMGATWFLPRRVSRQRATELLITGRLFTGREAAAYGMAIESRPADGVLPRALEIAHQIAGCAPVVVRQVLESLRGSSDATLEEQLAVEARTQAVNYASDDFAEGVAAVRDRRSPSFTGA